MMFLSLLSKRTRHTVQINGKGIEREAGLHLPPLFQRCCSAALAALFPGSTACCLVPMAEHGCRGQLGTATRGVKHLGASPVA